MAQLMDSGADEPSAAPSELAAEPVSLEGWYRDPLDPNLTRRRRILRRQLPPRSRWWDGTTWTTRTLVRDIEGLSWTPHLSQLAGPLTLPATATAEAARPIPAALEIPSAPPLAVVMTTPASDRLDPLVAAFGPAVAAIAEPVAPHRRLRRSAAAVLLAASLGALVAGSSAAVINRDRPQVASATTYTDAAAGFTLQYPPGWHVQSKASNSSIRFTVGARDAVLSQTNTVSVLVSSKPTPLGNLDALASQVPSGLRTQFPGVRLETASQTKLLGGPAFYLRLTVSDAVPAIRIEQYVGTTTSGRTLTVTVTVREPRTAPSQTEIQEFLDSIESI